MAGYRSSRATAVAAQLRTAMPIMFVAYTPVVILLGIVVIAWWRADIPISTFTRDPLQTLDAPAYTGIVSNIGVVLWTITAGICLFSSAVNRDSPRPGRDGQFLLSAGLVTLLLLIDDFFILHELEVAGLPQEAFNLWYAVALVWLLVRYRTEIRVTNSIFLALAYGWFAVSVGVDVTETVLPFPSVYFLEDGAKLAGIVSWSTYFIWRSFAYVHGSHVPSLPFPPHQ